MTTKKHVTKPAAEDALAALLGGGDAASETAGQFLADVMKATRKVATAVGPAYAGRIAQILVAVGHSVDRNNGAAELTKVANADISWDDIKEKLVKLNLIDRDEANNLELQAAA